MVIPPPTSQILERVKSRAGYTAQSWANHLNVRARCNRWPWMGGQTHLGFGITAQATEWGSLTHNSLPILKSLAWPPLGGLVANILNRILSNTTRCNNVLMHGPLTRLISEGK